MATAQKQLNDMRDVIVLGKKGDEVLTLKFRKHVYKNDWLPAWLAVCFIYLSFGIAVICSPLLMQANDRSWGVWMWCAIFSLVPLFLATGWIVGGYNDYKYIHEEFANLETLEQENRSTVVTIDDQGSESSQAASA
jgi:hypothetical protein